MSTQPPPDVIAAAKTAQSKWHIPASVQLAQWALESGWGKHLSAPFNCWGMKALPGQACVTVPTKECYRGTWVTVQAAFRSFESLADSFDAHAKLLATGKPYATARKTLPNPFEFARALTGTYATDPHYGALLGSIIHGSELTRYDNG